MSKFIDSERICPTCSTTFTCRIAVSLNVTRSPAYREAILAEKFHVFTCPSCNTRTLVDEPFIYTDFDRKHWIGVFPLAGEQAWSIHERSAPDAFFKTMRGPHTPAIARKMAEDFLVRTVFGLAALREKLVAFESGIDDADLAVFKLVLAQQMHGLLFHPDRRPLLRAVEGDTLVFHVFSQPDGGELIDVPRALFEETKNDPAFAILREELSQDSYVDPGRLMIEKWEEE